MKRADTIFVSALWLLCMGKAVADPVNFVPNWRSYTQTGNPADIVHSPDVAASIGRKVDALNGQMQNPEIQGGTAPGLDVTGSVIKADGAPLARTNAEHFSDIVNSHDFGIKCDASLNTTTHAVSGTDDTAAIQMAVNVAARLGSPINFHGGQCLISAPIVVPPSAAAFTLIGNSTVFIDTADSDVFTLVGENPSDTDFGRVRFDMRNMTIMKAANNFLGTAININGGKFRGIIDNVSISGFHIGIALLNTSQQRINNVHIDADSSIDSGAKSYGIYIEGTWQSGWTAAQSKFSANNTITGTTVIYGTGAYIGNAVQGARLDNFSTLEARGWGVQAIGSGNGNPQNYSEALEVRNSYLEGYLGGISADNLGLFHIINTNFDTPSIGAVSNWSAIHALGQFGGTVIGNTIDSYGRGQTTSPVVLGGDVVATGNNITGLSPSSSIPCFDLSPKTGVTDNMLISDNKCWASGGYKNETGGPIFGSDNLWSGLGNNQTLSVGFGNQNLDEITVSKEISSSEQNIHMRHTVDSSGNDTTTPGVINMFGTSYISFGANDPAGANQVVYLVNDTEGNLAVSSGGLSLAKYTSSTMLRPDGSCVPASSVFVTDGRNIGEAAGAGTGVIAYCTMQKHWFANGAPLTY
ncbi:hypothetical protein [Gluconobacter cerinus]|uniref:Pectate lyase superfamily protein domain-containing protein n=1 Tax=Gluconobacter cerinus TaxID=38307 RepID=A0AAV5NCI6_9PROT|nr:hypothetical protein [Gluconobacter cerinus]GBR03061.1 hypothetical protein AA0229_1855 [Gluconobacter cerinus NRIC 0229]GLQ61533.1 hypothetical protein GCM10007867_03780 [Gluconobacter cerinus]